RVHEYFMDAEPSILAVIILDGEAADMDRMAGVVAFGHRGDAGIERHGRVKDLEHRTHLVVGEGDLVEDPVLRLGRAHRAGMVRVEIRQRYHRDDLAGADIYDNAGGPLGAEIGDNPVQLLVQDELDASIERQLDLAAASLR